MKTTIKTLWTALLLVACSGRTSTVDPTFEVTDPHDTSGEAASSETPYDAGNLSTAPSEGLSTPDAGASTADAGATTTNVSTAVNTSPGPNTTDDGETGDSDCFQNPKTHFEIINACTQAVIIHKTPNLAGLNPDGSLPPLP